MRNANAQRVITMIRVGALRQPPGSHVSHAEIGGGPCLGAKPSRSIGADYRSRPRRRTKTSAYNAIGGVPVRMASAALC